MLAPRGSSMADTFRCPLVQSPLVGCARRGICALAMVNVMNEALLGRITIVPEVCHGKPCIRGLRCPVESFLELLGGVASAVSAWIMWVTRRC